MVVVRYCWEDAKAGRLKVMLRVGRSIEYKLAISRLVIVMLHACLCFGRTSMTYSQH